MNELDLEYRLDAIINYMQEDDKHDFLIDALSNYDDKKIESVVESGDYVEFFISHVENWIYQKASDELELDKEEIPDFLQDFIRRGAEDIIAPKNYKGSK